MPDPVPIDRLASFNLRATEFRDHLYFTEAKTVAVEEDEDLLRYHKIYSARPRLSISVHAQFTVDETEIFSGCLDILGPAFASSSKTQQR